MKMSWQLDEKISLLFFIFYIQISFILFQAPKMYFLVLVLVPADVLDLRFVFSTV